MKPVRMRKLAVIVLLLIVVGSAIALVLYALRQNISLFYTPTQIALGEAAGTHAIRAGGMVVPGSIERASGDLTVRFKITDYQHTIEVVYRGILPDLFREGQGIVAQGQLIDNQHFKATTVLAKHDEKYMPPEVRDSLKGSTNKISLLPQAGEGARRADEGGLDRKALIRHFVTPSPRGEKGVLDRSGEFI